MAGRRDDDGDGTALLTLLGRFRDAGGRVESVQEPTLGQLDFGSNVTTYIAGLVNAEKSRHIGKQVQLAHNRSRANGALVSRNPFGYISTGPKYHRALVPTKIGREYVPQIFARCIASQSAASIAAWLTQEGVPTPNKNRGNVWAPKSVGQIIRNPVYIGRRRNGKGVTVHVRSPGGRCDVQAGRQGLRQPAEARAAEGHHSASDGPSVLPPVWRPNVPARDARRTVLPLHSRPEVWCRPQERVPQHGAAG